MSEKDHYKFGLSKRGTRVNDNNTLAQELREEIREKDARIAQLEAVLRKYGNHSRKCESFEDGNCRCGLSDILDGRSTLETKGEQE
jgi:hypothetical protein